MQPAVWARIESQGVERIVRAIYDNANGSSAPVWTSGVATTIAESLPGCAVSLTIAEASDGAEMPNVELAPNELRVVRRIDATACLVLHLTFGSAFESSSYQRALLKRLAFHLENGARLVARPDAVWGHLERDGTCVSNRAEDPNPSELWSSLLVGRRSLAIRAWGGETSYLVLDAPCGRWRALTADERAVTLRFVRGASSKVIAGELRISQPRVSRALHQAAAKVGVPSTRELITVGARLENADRRPPERGALALTEAEHEVMLLVREGYSNAAIAAQRARSLRTVANQVASILKKTHCGSRRALSAVVVPSRPPPAPSRSGMFLSARAQAAARERDTGGAALAEG